MTVRVYLAGRLQIEAGKRLIREPDLPTRQGRLAFAYLAVEHWRPVSRDELASALWPQALPRAWESSLSAVLSKVRSVLVDTGIEISTLSRTHQLRLPDDSWVDIDAAVAAIDEAEGFLRVGDERTARAPASIAVAIAQRPFLAGEDDEWIAMWRSRLRGVLLRGLDCLSEVSRVNQEYALAIRFAEEAIELEPFRESGHRRLMRAYAEAGDGAEALRAFERCRRLLAEELGTDPAAQTTTLYMELLQSGQE